MSFRKDTFLDVVPLISSLKSNGDPKSAILSALWAKNFKLFEECVQAEGNDFGYVYKEFNNLRIIDLAAGKDEYLEVLIRAGVSLNEKNPSTKKSTLHYAAEAINPRALKLLLDGGASVNVQDNCNDTALHIIVQKWSRGWEDVESCLQILLEWPSINVNIANLDGCTPFLIAAALGDKTLIETFLKKCPSLDVDTFKRSTDNKSARELLVLEYPDQFDDLPSWKASPDNGISDYVYRLDYFARAKNEGRFCEVFRDALKKGQVDVLKHMDGQNFTYFQMACQNGLKKAVKLLLKQNIDVNYYGPGTASPIFLATQNGHDDILSILLVTPNIQLSNDDHNSEGLLHAILKLKKQTPGHHQCFRILLNNITLDPNCKDSEDRTCLHYAVKYGNDMLMYELLDVGARLDSTSKSGETPLSLISAPTLKKYLDTKIETNEQHPKTSEFAMVFKYQFAGSKNRSDHVYGISTDLLKSLSDSKELRCLLKHPIYATTIFLKWQRIRLIFYLELFFYSLFCFFLTCYLLYGNVVNECLEEEDILHVCGYNHHYVALAKLLILIFLAILGINKVVQFFLSPLQCIKRIENLLEIAVVIITSAAVTSNCALNKIEEKDGACRSITSLAILLAWFNFFFLIGKHPKLTIFIDMFKTASRYLFQLLAVHTSLLLAFALSFHMLFRGVDEYFSTVPNSIIKVIVMFTGEFEYKDLHFSEAPIVSHLVFAAFIYLVAIVLINLMVGLAVSATRPIEDDAFLYRCMAQVPIISYFENIFYNKSHVARLIKKPFKCFEKEFKPIQPNKDKYPALFVYPNQGNRTEVHFLPRDQSKKKTLSSEPCVRIKQRLTTKIVEDTWGILNNKTDSKIGVVDEFGKLHLEFEEVKRHIDGELEAIKEGLITILQKLEENDVDTSVSYKRAKLSNLELYGKLKKKTKLKKSSFDSNKL